MKKYYEENKSDLRDISYQQYFEEIKKINEERNKLELQKLAMQGKKRCLNCQASIGVQGVQTRLKRNFRFESK